MPGPFTAPSTSGNPRKCFLECGGQAPCKVTCAYAPALHMTHFRGCGGRTPAKVTHTRASGSTRCTARGGALQGAPPRGDVLCIWVRDRSAGNITASVAGVSRPLPIVTGRGHGGTATGSAALSRGLSRGTLERVTRVGHVSTSWGGDTVTGSIIGTGHHGEHHRCQYGTLKALPCSDGTLESDEEEAGGGLRGQGGSMHKMAYLVPRYISLAIP